MSNKKTPGTGGKGGHAAPTRKNPNNPINKPKKGGKKNSNASTRVVTFLSPNGKEFTTDNLAKFAKRFKLDSSSLSKVINGGRAHYKNWTVKATSFA